jgi:catechol 2,3-dioxygenase-like lactoylglutathione lyase family enzyme
MAEAKVEHVNITVSDAKVVAKVFCDLFDWTVRWHGGSLEDGISYHVGGKDSYLALYSNGGTEQVGNSLTTPGAMNHVGVVVEDMDVIEARVRQAGFTPTKHGDYEPGSRFYFDGPDGIEIEVISYQS